MKIQAQIPMSQKVTHLIVMVKLYAQLISLIKLLI